MATRARSIRAGVAELEQWEQAAARAGLKLNAWVRRACNQTAELERAIDRLAEKEAQAE